MNVTLNGVTYHVDAVTLDGTDTLVLTPLDPSATAAVLAIRVPR